MEAIVEYLNMVKEIIQGNWITVVVMILPWFAPNKWVYATCRAGGKLASALLRQRIGKQGEKVEKWFQGTLDAAVRGLNDGLDADDAC